MLEFTPKSPIPPGSAWAISLQLIEFQFIVNFDFCKKHQNINFSEWTHTWSLRGMKAS
jgi:hypothetical protein